MHICANCKKEIGCETDKSVWKVCDCQCIKCWHKGELIQLYFCRSSTPISCFEAYLASFFSVRDFNLLQAFYRSNK